MTSHADTAKEEDKSSYFLEGRREIHVEILDVSILRH